MRRATVILLLTVCAFLEFQFYPGHSYLGGESQVLAPMIERLQFPGLLSRDLVATHPILRYTAYDEATLALVRAARLSLENALLAQLFLARFAAITGAFLLASSCGIRWNASLLIAGISGLGAALPALHISTAEREPVPYALALGWTVLATGAALRGRILAAGLAGGIALLYSPAISLPWWICIIAAAAWRKPSRPILRPLLTTFAIAALLIANLAQLQPGAPGGNSLFSFVSVPWKGLLERRTPGVLVQTWIGHEGWLFAGVAVCGMCALFRCGGHMARTARRFVYAILGFGLLSMPFAWVMQKFLPWELWLHVEPARSLALAASICLVLLGSAAGLAWQKRRVPEVITWGLALSGLLATPLLKSTSTTKPEFSAAGIRSLSRWAQSSTWGGSMFLFTNSGKRTDAGQFRTLALRPVYVDWESGELSRFYRDFACEWSARWDRVHARRQAAEEMASLLSEPIDYYVAATRDRLPRIMPVFATEELVVYDARDLRDASKKLAAAKATRSN